VDRTLIIAEIGINHQGDINIFKKMMLSAKQCGVDAVKSQKRVPRLCYTDEQYNAPRVDIDGITKSYGECKEALELSGDEWIEAMAYADEIGIPLFASAWDIESAKFVRDIGTQVIKISSANLIDRPLLEEVAGYGLPIILSTGMSTTEEVDTAVDILKNTDLTLMHCTSCYPCKNEDINLRVIPELIKRYKLPVGFSGHHTGVALDAVAVAMGACMIERHFTLDRSMQGTDHAASLEPVGMERVVKYIRAVEVALGTEYKTVLDCERGSIEKLRAYINKRG